MIAAPRTAFRPVGSPVWRPTRAPSYRGGGSATLNQAVAFTASAGLRRTTGLPAVAGVLATTYSMGFWAKLDAGMVADTWSDLAAARKVGDWVAGKYVQIYANENGVDRYRLSLDYGGPAKHSAFSFTPGTWAHVCMTVTARIVRLYVNAAAVNLEGSPTWDVTGMAIDEIGEIAFGRPAGTGAENVFLGSMRAPFVCAKALSQAEVATVMAQTAPGTGVSGFSGYGAWGLNGVTDLADQLGGGPLVAVGAPTTDTAGPAGLAA